MSDAYNYHEIGYQHVALHRCVTEFDPRRTNNPLILDYFREIDKAKFADSSVFYTILNSERKISYQGNRILPISFTSVLYTVSKSWVDIINKMVFEENAYASFVGEYKDLVENIILYDNPTEKENLVYRYENTGETVFHSAGKIWLYKKYRESITRSIKVNLDKELKYILQCYEDLEWYFGDERKYCLLYLMNKNNDILIDTLTEFMSSLVKNTPKNPLE